jgi:hypothetical protein
MNTDVQITVWWVASTLYHLFNIQLTCAWEIQMEFNIRAHYDEEETAAFF